MSVRDFNGLQRCDRIFSRMFQSPDIRTTKGIMKFHGSWRPSEDDIGSRVLHWDYHLTSSPMPTTIFEDDVVVSTSSEILVKLDFARKHPCCRAREDTCDCWVFSVVLERILVRGVRAHVFMVASRQCVQEYQSSSSSICTKTFNTGTVASCRSVPVSHITTRCSSV